MATACRHDGDASCVQGRHLLVGNSNICAFFNVNNIVSFHGRHSPPRLWYLPKISAWDGQGGPPSAYSEARRNICALFEIVCLLCCFLLTLVPQNIVFRLERFPPQHMLFYANLPAIVADATRLEERLAFFECLQDDEDKEWCFLCHFSFIHSINCFITKYAAAARSACAENLQRMLRICLFVLD